MWLYSDKRVVLDLADQPVFVSSNLPLVDDMIKLGVPELSLINWAADFIHEGKIFVDIGANIGSWSVMLGRKGKQGVAFEAMPTCCEYLDLNLQLNKVRHLVTPHPVGIGSPEQAATEKHTALAWDPKGGGLMQDRDLFAKLQGGTVRDWTTEVEMTIHTLDSYQLENVGLIKIDIEGNELNAILGADDTIARCKPFMMFEAWPWEWYDTNRKRLFNYVSSLGYRVLPINGYEQMWLAEPMP